MPVSRSTPVTDLSRYALLYVQPFFCGPLLLLPNPSAAQSMQAAAKSLGLTFESALCPARKPNFCMPFVNHCGPSLLPLHPSSGRF
jgi:hypothetical protein